MNHSKLSKANHFLNESDLSSADKMNYKSVEKVSSENVRTLLKKHIKDSDATIAYLKLIDLFMNAFQNENLAPLERVEDAWFCIFF